MANHVHWSITFDSINDAAKEKLKEILGRVRTDTSHQWLGDIFVDPTSSTTYEETEQYSWTTEHIGPKWSYIEDMDADEGYLNGESAWSAPDGALDYLLEELSELDPELITIFTYEDEAPNFAGVYVYDGDELYDGWEDEYEEIVDAVIAEYPKELHGKYNFDDLEWEDDESSDFFQDVMWESLSDRQWEDAANFVASLKEWRNEHAIGETA